MFWLRHAFERPRSSLALYLALCLILLSVVGCRHRQPRPVVPIVPTIGETQTGIASWYGEPYHGRRAANGEIYDMEQLTAAHRTLPFETWVRVQNLANSKTVDVRITDRGPFVDGRIIDLSRAAARQIEMIGPGTARVRIQVIAAPAAVGGEFFAVQVGAFRERSNARRLQREMEREYGTTRVLERDGDPVLWRVVVGDMLTAPEAAALRERIRVQHRQAFVVRLDAE